MMKKHLNYWRYILVHKFYVGIECWKRGLYIRAIIHDWTKFKPSEWMAYADFFNPDGQATPAIKERFAMAWLRHCHVNDHHWQSWISFNDKGDWRPREMSDKARREMLADWIGASKAQGKDGGKDLKDWYLERQKTMPLAPKTRAWLEREMGV